MDAKTKTTTPGLEAALLRAAATGHYVSIFMNPDRKWRARVGDTAYIADRFDELPALLTQATEREEAILRANQIKP